MGKFSTILVFALIGLFAVYQYQQHVDEPLGDFVVPGDPVMHLGDIAVRVAIAADETSRKRGLSGQESLGSLDGLLFIFDEPGYHGIWMKNMKFPIDVIWIDESLTIVGISENLEPSSYPKVFEPPVPVKYAVETDPDFAGLLGIQKGQKVRLPAGYGTK